MPNIPNPALLTPCGAPNPGAAPVLPLAPALPVPLASPLAPVLLALELGVPVADAVLFPLQKILLGLTPPSMKHFCRSAMLC